MAGGDAIQIAPDVYKVVLEDEHVRGCWAPALDLVTVPRCTAIPTWLVTRYPIARGPLRAPTAPRS